MARVTKEETSAAAVPLAFSLQFDSSLPSEAELRNAALDPLAESSEATNDRPNPLLARKLQRDATAIAQAVQVITVNRGLGAFASLGDGPLKAVLRGVSEQAFDADRSIVKLIGGAASFVDVAMKATGSVPFVGLAASVIMGAVQFVYNFAGAGYAEKRAPLYLMNPAKDSDDTVRALELLADGDDWTPLFLPRTRGVFTSDAGGALPGDFDPKHPMLGGWEESAREGGWQFARPLAEGLRFGVAPGQLDYVDVGVQARISPADCTLPSKRKPRYTDVFAAGKNLAVAHDLVFPLGEWLPSLAALGRATWATVGQSTGAAMFNVDASRVSAEWQTFEDSMVAWRSFLQSVHGRRYDARLPDLGEKERRKHIALFLARVAAAHHDRLNVTTAEQLLVTITGRKPGAGATVGKRAVEHAERLAKRQRAAVKTTLAALVSKQAPAFKGDPALLEALLRSRAEQLAAGKFDALDLDEVPDAAMRRRISERRDSLRTSSGRDPEREAAKRKLEAWVIRTQIPSPLGFDEPAATGGGILLPVLGGITLAGLAGLALSRR